MIEDEGTQERAFRAGQLHQTSYVRRDRIAYYRREHPELLRIDPYQATEMLTLNVRRTPLSDPKVRLALSLAIDRDAIVHSVSRGDEKAATGYTPPGLEGYEPFNVVRFDPDRARQVLAEVGFPKGNGFPRLQLCTANLDLPRNLAQAIQAMWRQELNIDVQLESEERRVFLDSVSKGNFQIAIYR